MRRLMDSICCPAVFPDEGPEAATAVATQSVARTAATTLRSTQGGTGQERPEDLASLTTSPCLRIEPDDKSNGNRIARMRPTVFSFRPKPR
jgi:hypothetical protein